MRIIKQGKIPIKEKEHTCKNCQTVFVYEPADVKHDFDSRDTYSEHYVTCPLCKNTIIVKPFK